MKTLEPYSVLNLPQIEPIAVAGVLWKPLRRTLGIDAYGINAYSAAAAGEHVVEEHTEETLGHQEVYVVIAAARRSRSTESTSTHRTAPPSSFATRRCAGMR